MNTHTSGNEFSPAVAASSSGDFVVVWQQDFGQVLRQQMAVFLLRTLEGASYVPPPAAGVFGDVACPSLFADWIEELAARAIAAGCGGGNYCPLDATTRGQMAPFLVKTFGLLLYGP